MRIGLLPLDERPVNTRYPAMIAAITGADLLLPPPGALSARRRPANPIALAGWLEAAAPELGGLIVSLELLGYGGLIASRTSDDPTAAVLARLEALRALRRSHPRLPIYAFSVITRVSNANDAVEEPLYWAAYGERLYALSQLLDRRGQGHAVAADLASLEADIPAAHRRDFLARRLRNHAVNLAALHMLGDDVFDLLVLSSDDTSPYGMPSRERRWIAEWAQLMGIDAGRLLMYPGADEVGCALVARLLNGRAGVTPTVTARYAPAEAAENVAAYEDGPIRLTVERQIVAVGGRLCSPPPDAGEGQEVMGGDIWLGVNAPLARRSEWSPAHAHAERDERLPALRDLVAAAQARLRAGRPAAIADVAYPNGADPALTDLLLDGFHLPGLAAYGAWNTAGNTIGTALAHACAARLISSPEGRAAHERFLLHRLVEDWGYQHLVRAEVRAWLRATYDTAEPADSAAMAAAVARIEAGLNAAIGRLPGFAGRYQLVPGSTRLPWGRMFEVDFALQTLPQ
jgi:hypothetical protein